MCAKVVEIMIENLHQSQDPGALLVLEEERVHFLIIIVSLIYGLIPRSRGDDFQRITALI